jgi:hypothetical protein
MNKKTKNKYLKKSDYESDDGYVMAGEGDSVVSIVILLSISFFIIATFFSGA